MKSDSFENSTRGKLLKLLEEIRLILIDYSEGDMTSINSWGKKEAKALRYFINNLIDENIKPIKKKNVVFYGEKKNRKGITIEGKIGSCKIERPIYNKKYINEWISISTLLVIFRNLKDTSNKSFNPNQRTLDLFAIAGFYDGWQGYKSKIRITELGKKFFNKDVHSTETEISDVRCLFHSN